jgi:Rieske Fe-S protein
LDPKKLKRRGFVKICASAAVSVSASPSLLANQQCPLRRYNRVKLVDAQNRPLSPEALEEGASYVFNYPYVTTPCFLINLGRPASGNELLHTESGQEYRWQGGVGPHRSIVSFCAICAHKMSHPSKSVSFINYRHEDVSFRDKDENSVRRPGVIYCCSEKSVYDAARGARVLGGPAPQPLAAIALEYDEKTGEIYASGTCGGELYQKFFETFAFRLALEFGTSNIQQKVVGTSTVLSIEDYSATQMLC